MCVCCTGCHSINYCVIAHYVIPNIIDIWEHIVSLQAQSGCGRTLCHYRHNQSCEHTLCQYKHNQSVGAHCVTSSINNLSKHIMPLSAHSVFLGIKFLILHTETQTSIFLSYHHKVKEPDLLKHLHGKDQRWKVCVSVQIIGNLIKRPRKTHTAYPRMAYSSTH